MGTLHLRTRVTRAASLVLLACTLQPDALICQSGSPPQAETITIDAQASAHPFPHYWERMFGSGRAILSLRESYRRDLRMVKRATDFQYVRFHALFHDEVGVYAETDDEQPVYNFSYVDQIYDGLLENGIRPFVELSFMPRRLASTSTTQAFWYKPYVSPPKDGSHWEALIEQFGRHLVSRYGLDEVAQWYFEVWNEPNIDFWAGEPKEQTYYELYDRAARALKRVSPRLRVGGPATAQAAWVDRFIRHCAEKAVPVDFVSTHVYANDSAEDVFGSHETISRNQMVCRAVRRVHDRVRSSAMPDLPLLWSEYNASYKNEPQVTDSLFMGPWLADTIRQCDGLVDMLAYWTFSDVFEEQGVVKQPFYGGFGLIATGGLPKPSFNAFKLLHWLGDQRLAAQTESALVTRRADGALVIAVWNLFLPEEPGAPKQIVLKLNGLAGGRHARVHRLDAEHGSLLSTYEAIGQPAYPTRDQTAQLRRAAELPAPETVPLREGTLRLTLPPHGLALVEIPSVFPRLPAASRGATTH